MSPKDLASKSLEELQKMIGEQGALIRDLRFKIATRQHAKGRVLREAKKDLARLLTALRQHKILPV